MNVDEEIERLLSFGAKTPTKLREDVIGITGVSERVYYRHLKRLRIKNIVEEKSETTIRGDLIRKYALSRKSEGILVMKRGEIHARLTQFPKSVWELFAWSLYSPGGWSFDDEEVKMACDLIPKCYFRNVVFPPRVKKYNLDPDRYVYEWPDTFREELKIGSPLPRFFNLKTIYQAKLIGAINELGLKGAPSFLGIKEYADNYGNNRQIAVVVRRRTDSRFQVFRVESNTQSSKQWVDALCNEHGVSGLQIINSTHEALVRRTVFHLDKVLKDRRLLIPSKYSLLLKDLCLFNFSYTPPLKPGNREEELMLQEYRETAGNFVHALAAAVSCADGTTSTQRLMMLKKRLKFW